MICGPAVYPSFRIKSITIKFLADGSAEITIDYW
jgi:hypothetical protein